MKELDWCLCNCIDDLCNNLFRGTFPLTYMELLWFRRKYVHLHLSKTKTCTSTFMYFLQGEKKVTITKFTECDHCIILAISISLCDHCIIISIYIYLLYWQWSHPRIIAKNAKNLKLLYPLFCLYGHQSITFIALNQYCAMKKRDPFAMHEMVHKIGKIVIFSKQYKILEIQKCYSMALVLTFEIPEIESPGT